MSQVMRALLPKEVQSSEVFGYRQDVFLFPEEMAVIANSVEKRRREFASVRACAREALARLRATPTPIVPGESGAPQWPIGIVGSMTHCDGYSAASVAFEHTIAAIGIDAEPNAPTPPGVFDVISVREDRIGLNKLPDLGVAWDRLLFSAKESVYKTWFPLTESWLGFEDVIVTFHLDGSFEATFLVDGPLVEGRRIPGLAGRWKVGRGILATAIALPRRGSPKESHERYSQVSTSRVDQVRGG
ncbi:4'-phosphopantetheinyl transferase family protein [Rathayibacter iranicus]|uniref:4'-phosphopantetheinyl transferase family protein n=1 Tax=Rathayibacter iranicus TaxID=59737 RepID=UPI001923389E|nr:4'-phosphopantetheinyl transferase superfamily protein [Rathayibacter iranicus]